MAGGKKTHEDDISTSRESDTLVDMLESTSNPLIEYLKIILPILCTVLLFIAIFFYAVFPVVQRHAIENHKRALEDIVLATMSTLDVLAQDVKNGEIPLAQAQEKAKEQIRRIRFGDDGGNYLWINDLEPKMIMHPYRPDLEGKNLADYRDPSGKQIFLLFSQVARETGGGFSEYLWQWQNDSTKIGEKLSYVKLFKPWNWVVGTGVYLDDLRAELALMKRTILMGGTGIFAVMILLSLYITNTAMAGIRGRRRAELRLLERERLYRTLTENVDDGIMRMDRTLRHLYASPAVTALTGIPRDTFPGKTVRELGYMGEQQTLWEGALLQTFESGEKQRLEFIMPNGRGVEWLIIPEIDDTGAVVTVLTSARDITERRELEREHNRLALVIEQAHELVLVTNTDGVIEYVNPAFERGTGHTLDEIAGKKPSILKSGKHDKAFYEALWRTIKAGHVWKGHFINRRKNGTLYHEDATITPLRNDLGDIIAFVGVKRDVTHEYELESQLRQAQRMEAIGTLAGGIAHDFNNILSAIVGHTELTLLDLPEDSEFREGLEEVLKASHRATEMVHQILAFSRMSEVRRIPLQLTQIVKEALRLIRGSLPATIEIHQEIAASCPLVDADPTQMHQVLMNLCTNAYHAMEEKGGVLTVGVNTETVSGMAPQHRELTPGRYVVLSVADTGCGIDSAISERIFDPFFTTKPEGRGTGMGLATVHGIMKSHDGHIVFSSELGKGSEFRIYLPAVDKTATNGAATADANPFVRHGDGELIAIVDDEPAVAMVLGHLLMRAGFRSVNYLSAIEFLEQTDAELDIVALILSDSTMPKMTGIEFAAALRQRGRRIPMLLMSGLVTDALVERAQREGIQHVFKKPIDHKELFDIVLKLLGKKPAETTL